jgi:cobyrinic acid a,c-diamide synthase
MSRRRMIIAGTESGVGKTTITLGIMSALRKRGYMVQGFKCGPDYIDPTYHAAVTGRISRNLDSWMLSAEALKEVFIRGSIGADISIIEGMMGSFDGKDPLSNQGSTAKTSLFSKEISLAYETNGWIGRYKEGYMTKNVVAGYTHLHFASYPKLAENFVNACERRKRENE